MSHSLDTVMDEIHQHALQLEAVLQREASLLRQPQGPEALSAAVADKLDLVQALEHLERQRRQLDQRNSRDLSNSPQWRQTGAILRRCQALNNQAGADITLQTRQARSALDILTGASSADAPLYSADGDTRNNRTSHALGRA